jgi:4-hydroxythreonine-4-phosphate dehydrogenase
MSQTPGTPRVAIALGDPRGIGAEITRKALESSEVSGTADFVLVGTPSGLEAAGPASQSLEVGPWSLADGDAAAGRVAGEAVRVATGLALRGEVQALVTAPIDKAAFHAGGWTYPGHTEMLQALCDAPTVAMMMAAERTLGGGPLRVVLATTHVALRDVPGLITVELLESQGVLAARALRRWWGIEAPRVAVCALNPHAGDGGLFGDEEARILTPVVDRLRRHGIRAEGPVPADTVFVRAMRDQWDLVLVPYHDVGMAAFKTAAFGFGVNVTVGLPFPRTSPDHGTALDIAGQGRADASSMIEAVRLAVRLARCL